MHFSVPVLYLLHTQAAVAAVMRAYGKGIDGIKIFASPYFSPDDRAFIGDVNGKTPLGRGMWLDWSLSSNGNLFASRSSDWTDWSFYLPGEDSNKTYTGFASPDEAEKRGVRFKEFVFDGDDLKFKEDGKLVNKFFALPVKDYPDLYTVEWGESDHPEKIDLVLNKRYKWEGK